MALAIFVVVGGGLAAPVVLATAVPASPDCLPRPGPWMVWFKQLLAFPLYGTVAWLMWVLVQEVDPGDAFLALARPGLVGFAVWIYGRTRLAEPRPRRRSAAVARGRGVAAALLVAATLAPGGGAAGTAANAPAARSATRRSARRGSTGSPPSIARSSST